MWEVWRSQSKVEQKSKQVGVKRERRQWLSAKTREDETSPLFQMGTLRSSANVANFLLLV